MCRFSRHKYCAIGSISICENSRNSSASGDNGAHLLDAAAATDTETRAIAIGVARTHFALFMER